MIIRRAIPVRAFKKFARAPLAVVGKLLSPFPDFTFELVRHMVLNVEI